MRRLTMLKRNLINRNRSLDWIILDLSKKGYFQLHLEIYYLMPTTIILKYQAIKRFKHITNIHRKIKVTISTFKISKFRLTP
jgi:hypothetical protein